MISYQQESETRQQSGRGKFFTEKAAILSIGRHTLCVETTGPKIYHTFDYEERITISVVMTSRSETGLGHVPTAMSNEGRCRGALEPSWDVYSSTRIMHQLWVPQTSNSAVAAHKLQKSTSPMISTSGTHLRKTPETRYPGGQYWSVLTLGA
jgi:hypothetical protein